MNTSQIQTWIPFSDFFVEAEARGLLLEDAAKGLHLSICLEENAGRVRGLRRLWEFVDEPMFVRQARYTVQNQADDLAWRLQHDTLASAERCQLHSQWERLRQEAAEPDPYREVPRDPLKRAVPPNRFRQFEAIEADLTSSWIDDEDEPEQAASLNWVAGAAEFHLYFEREAYSNMEIECSLAALILEEPDKPHVIAGPSSSVNRHTDEERDQWILDWSGKGGADQAHKDYKAHPRFDGTKLHPFRALFRNLRRPPKGRPPKTVS